GPRLGVPREVEIRDGPDRGAPRLLRLSARPARRQPPLAGRGWDRRDHAPPRRMGKPASGPGDVRAGRRRRIRRLQDRRTARIAGGVRQRPDSEAVEFAVAGARRTHVRRGGDRLRRAAPRAGHDVGRTVRRPARRTRGGDAGGTDQSGGRGGEHGTAGHSHSSRALVLNSMRRLSLLIACLALAPISTLRAQANYEIQVYPSETADKNTTFFELHSK